MVLSAKYGRTQEHATATLPLSVLALEDEAEKVAAQKKDPKILPKNCQIELESSSYQ